MSQAEVMDRLRREVDGRERPSRDRLREQDALWLIQLSPAERIDWLARRVLPRRITGCAA